MEPTQDCARCHQSLALEAYHPGKRGKVGTWCRACYREYMRDYRPIWRKTSQKSDRPQRAELPTHCRRVKPDTGLQHGPQPEWVPSSSYDAVHSRIKKVRGPASAHQCIHCGDVARDWAYDHLDPAPLVLERQHGVVEYSADLSHYQPMCRSCHAKFDLRETSEDRSARCRRTPSSEPRPTPITAW
jgi:hypothetical protein